MSRFWILNIQSRVPVRTLVLLIVSGFHPYIMIYDIDKFTFLRATLLHTNVIDVFRALVQPPKVND